eukprot:IDg2969t1
MQPKPAAFSHLSHFPRFAIHHFTSVASHLICRGLTRTTCVATNTGASSKAIATSRAAVTYANFHLSVLRRAFSMLLIQINSFEEGGRAHRLPL